MRSRSETILGARGSVLPKGSLAGRELCVGGCGRELPDLGQEKGGETERFHRLEKKRELP
ncbi:MAG: hypothetical protein CMN04_00050 [Roseibacillus sp.]|nr:hypothetical protein [Roseibacillus sp.]